MDKRIDLICQHTMEGKIIPLKLRFQDEDGELQEYSVKGYRDTSEFGITSFECKIIVRDTMKFVRIFSSVPSRLHCRGAPGCPQRLSDGASSRGRPSWRGRR